MAGTIAGSISITITNGGFSDTISSRSISITQDGIGAASGVRSVGTTEEELLATDVSTLGYCYMKNLDSTNFVEWGPYSGGTFYPIGKLEAGEEAWFRLSPGKTLYGKADTATVKLDCRIYED